MFKGTEEVDWLPGRHVRIVLVVHISITGRYQKGIYLTGPHTDVVTWVEVRQRASHFISFSLTTLHDVGLSDALALISVFLILIEYQC